MFPLLQAFMYYSINGDKREDLNGNNVINDLVYIISVFISDNND